jgi:hypothetical protein
MKIKITKCPSSKCFRDEESFVLEEREERTKENQEREGLDEQDREFFVSSELCDINSLSQYVHRLYNGDEKNEN